MVKLRVRIAKGKKKGKYIHLHLDVWEIVEMSNSFTTTISQTEKTGDLYRLRLAIWHRYPHYLVELEDMHKAINKIYDIAKLVGAF